MSYFENLIIFAFKDEFVSDDYCIYVLEKPFKKLTANAPDQDPFPTDAIKLIASQCKLQMGAANTLGVVSTNAISMFP